MVSIPVQDRRTFGAAFVFGFILIILGLLCLLGHGIPIFIVSFSFITLGVLTLYVVEQVSRPPSNDMAHFSRKRSLQEKGMRNNRDTVDVSSAAKRSPPILLCLGDSITHGRATSANFVDSIEPALRRRMKAASISPSSKIGVTITKAAKSSGDGEVTLESKNPIIEVINAGQNSICSWTILHERIPYVIACKPDFVAILIGTNDIRGVFRKDWGDQLITMWKFPSGMGLSLEAFEANLGEMVDHLLRGLPDAQLGILTLPPMGEGLSSHANTLVREANDRISKIVSRYSISGNSKRIKILDVYHALEHVIMQPNADTASVRPPRPVDEMVLHACWMNFAHYLFGISWNDLSRKIGNKVLSDGLHLNETGRDIVADNIVSWLAHE